MPEEARNVEPGKQNWVNWSFGSLLLAVRDDDRQAQKQLVRGFHSLAISNAPKNGWFHPGGIKEWCSIADVALAERLNQYRDLERAAIEDRRAKNGFADVYYTILYRQRDEVRKLMVQKDKNCQPSETIWCFSANGDAIHADRKLQRDDLLHSLETLEVQFDDGEVTGEILRQARLILLDPTSVRTENYRAEIVGRLVEERGISPQQARKDVDRFQELAARDESLLQIRDQLRSVARFSAQVIPKDQYRDERPGAEM